MFVVEAEWSLEAARTANIISIKPQRPQTTALPVSREPESQWGERGIHHKLE